MRLLLFPILMLLPSIALARTASLSFFWADWGPWTRCSATCGNGVQTRRRDCPDGGCMGSDEDRRKCSLAPCVQWQPWNNWAPCSASCGHGTRTRSRFCPNYFGCGQGNRMQTEECNVKPCRDWRPWSGWRACSAFCGGGVQQRNRACPSGAQCDGQSSEKRPCNTHSCCTNWSRFSRCSVTCGDNGVEKRTRRCTVDAPGVPGGYASKLENEKRPCNPSPQPCASWSQWGAWESCSASCGQGERRKSRTCSIPGACRGYAEEYEACDSGPCAEWRQWSAWSFCAVTCGGGKKARTRVCTGGGPDAQCEGNVQEEAGCGNFPCPEWSNWAPWSACSESCDGGWQKRGRVCNQYNLCPGDSKQKQLCNTHQCPAMEQWGSWGDCSKDCGGGFQIRSRSCRTDREFCKGDKIDLQSCLCDETPEAAQACNSHQCAYWGHWGAWGACSASCAGGEKTRRRSCVTDRSFCVGLNRRHPSCLCDGPDSETDLCGTQSCAEWSSWEDWGACNAHCGGGARERKHTCIKDEDFCSRQPDHASCICPGLNHSNEQCNVHLCPRWSRWGRWGECTKSCEGGARQRRRTCQNDQQVCSGTGSIQISPSCQCEGNSEDSSECNTHQCAIWMKWNQWAACNQICGDGGTQIRERQCKVDFTKCYGAALLRDTSCQCPGPKRDEQECNRHSCPSWMDWGSWADCSVSCGTGQKNRIRECLVDSAFCTDERITEAACECQGSYEQRDDCDAGPCFAWSAWARWSDCSQVCGGGSRSRARQCPQIGGCPGLATETDFCNQIICPEWGDWSPWSSCSVTCGGGKRAKTRACPLKGGCSPGEPVEVDPCNDDNCPAWSEWGEWSTCSATCGKGGRTKTRLCSPLQDGCLGEPKQVEACFIEPCALNTYWSGWSPCTQTCGSGTQTRSRAPCPTCTPEDEVKPCGEGPCPFWSAWDNWSECSVTCGSGQRLRSRFCESAEDGTEIPQGCVGGAQEIDPQPCQTNSCIR